MTSHLSKVHLRERASKPRTDDLYDDVFLQTWGSGPTRSYWTVSVNGSTLRQANRPCADEHLKSVREREQARREEQQRIALTDTGTQTLQNTGPWMERTRWPIAYQGVRRDILLGLADVPVAHDADDLTIGQLAMDLFICYPVDLFICYPVDLFICYPEYHVLVCRSCAYAVAPPHLAAHMATTHASDICSKDNLHRTTKVAATLATRLREEYDLLDATTSIIPRPPPTKPPFPNLKLSRGYQCTRCDLTRTETKTALREMETHFNEHRLVARKRGQPAKLADIPEEDRRPTFKEICCQRFFNCGAQAKYFEVNVPSEVQTLVKTRPRGHADLYRALIDEQLTAGSHEQEVRAEIYSSQVTKTESPWLEMTRWPRYFHGLNMADVVPLAYAANPVTEPALVLGESFDRLIEHAHQSILDDRISVFDQAKINSFIAGRSGKHDRMLMVKLRKSTFRAYKGLWKRLLCFLCHLDRALRLAEEILSCQRQPGSDASSTDGDRAGEVVRDLDRASLQLCIALPDHTLKGDHFESVVLSFLAVLGIDENPGAVFLVATKEGEVDHPSDMLDEMRERFMVRGSRTAFDWACRLRSYAKKVVSNTTSLGSITWSEDGSSVQYKDTGFSMDALRKFVASQVLKAQQELEGLLLLHPDEARDDVVPHVLLHRLQDNHGNERKGWNFLQDQRNSGQL
ncbi:hypothetical protein PSPO01_16282 [Paraphaeosphaeria sporulosa]